ncbi:MAG: hypothetical protein M3P98_00705 [bacterium]|nr:hypothetical protein [bacterium]
MIDKKVKIVLLISALVLGYYGVRFVTQAGQGLDAIQNDGYAGTGAVMLLASGFIVGWITEKKTGGKDARK